MTYICNVDDNYLEIRRLFRGFDFFHNRRPRRRYFLDHHYRRRIFTVRSTASMYARAIQNRQRLSTQHTT